MIPRQLVNLVIKNHKSGFVDVIYGPRRVGKTVLLDQILAKFPQDKTLLLNGDTQEARDQLSDTSEVRLTNLVQNYSIIVVDEAQRITNVGLALKIIIDKFPDKKIFVTGSSSLELSRGIQETLTGRSHKYKLYPLSTVEISQGLPKYQIPYLLPEQLLYGGYPYVRQLSTIKEKQDYLSSIVEDYLFRDLFDLERIENPDIVKKLASLLAFQVGNEVSLNELAQRLSINVRTVSRYLNLLSKTFVIFELGAFSTNLRNEVTGHKKYYFYDLGIRNALINQFMVLDSRTDVGALWENFLVVERLKQKEIQSDRSAYYFWRDYSQAEIDWIEKSAVSLQAFEFKWGKASYTTPKSFIDAYQTEATVISQDNYLNFVYT